MKKTSQSTAGPSAAGFTLTELLVAMAISAVLLSQMLVATYALQRSFEASNYRMSAQEDQLRMLDFVTRDLHMASAVTVQNGGAQITVTLPPANTTALDLNLGSLLTPAIASTGSPAAAGSATTVVYFAEGGQFIRQVGDVQTVVADTVADLTFNARRVVPVGGRDFHPGVFQFTDHGHAAGHARQQPGFPGNVAAGQ